MLQQERQRGVHRLGVDQVVVVKDQQHLVVTGLGGQLVSSDSQATGRRPLPAQSASRAVLPNPAGAQTTTSPRASPRGAPPAAAGGHAEGQTACPVSSAGPS